MPRFKVLHEGEKLKLVEIKPGDVADIRTGESDGIKQSGGDGQMKVGWMWFDNDSKRSIEEKIQRAAERFRAKFGRWPDTCHVNNRAAPGGSFVCGKVRVVAVPNILPHHFWLGPLEKAA